MKFTKQISKLLTTEFPENALFSKTDIKRLLMPIIAETVLSYLVGLADSVMVSSAGEAAVSAVSLVNALFILFINVFAAIAAGGAAVCGQYIGRGEQETARRVAVEIAVLMLAISGAATVCLILCKNALLGSLFGNVEEAVYSGCETYYRIVIYSIPGIALYNAGAAIFRTDGDGRTPLIVSVLMNALNIIGNAVLIYGFKLGVAGVAIPSLVSRTVAMAVILVLALRRSFSLNLRGIIRYKPSRLLIGQIFSIGIPAGIENGMFEFGKLILISLVAILPTSSITANAVGNTLGALHLVVALAVSAAIPPVVSRCAGIGDYAQARFYTRYFIKLCYIADGIVNILLIIGIPLTNRIYGLSPESARLSTIILLLHGIASIVIWPLSFLFSATMRAAGDSRYAMIIASISMWLCRVGGSFLMIRVFHLGVTSVWVAWIIDWVFRTCFFLPRYLGHKWEGKAVKSAEESITG